MKYKDILNIFFFLAIVSCEKNETDLSSLNYFLTIVDTQNNDFFESNSDYKAYQIEFISLYNDYQFGPSLIYNRNGFTTIAYSQEQAALEGSVYIDFGNGDIDTLEIDYSPGFMGGSDFPFGGVDQVDFYFNGDLIKTWNFQENPDLRSAVLDFTAVDPNNPEYKEIYGEGIIWITKEVSEK